MRRALPAADGVDHAHGLCALFQLTRAVRAGNGAKHFVECREQSRFVGRSTGYKIPNMGNGIGDRVKECHGSPLFSKKEIQVQRTPYGQSCGLVD